MGVTLEDPPLYVPEFEEGKWALLSMEERWRGEVNYDGYDVDYAGIGWM